MTLTALVAQAVTIMVPMLMSLTIHEFAHALAARFLGDDTAMVLGRLSLNPLAHADWLGTIILPFMTLLAAGAGTQLPFLGWAKPVPVNPTRFYRRVGNRLGTAVVAFAGPLANLLLALGCAVCLSFLAHRGLLLGTMQQPSPFLLFLSTMLSINVGLFVFNMLPIYPLDGQQILGSVLSPHLSLRYARFNAQFGSILLLMVVFFARDLVAIPVLWMRILLLRTAGL